MELLVVEKLMALLSRQVWACVLPSQGLNTRIHPFFMIKEIGVLVPRRKGQISDLLTSMKLIAVVLL